MDSLNLKKFVVHYKLEIDNTSFFREVIVESYNQESAEAKILRVNHKNNKTPYLVAFRSVREMKFVKEEARELETA
jgi:hypothetical protein